MYIVCCSLLTESRLISALVGKKNVINEEALLAEGGGVIEVEHI